MKSFTRTALLGAAGLVAMSVSAHAASPMAATDSPLFKPAATTESILLAQRQRDENPGGAGFRNENPGGAGFRDENPGGAGAKKKAKKKKARK